MTGLVLIQFVDEEDKPITNTIQVPESISVDHLRQIHTFDPSNSFYIHGHQITTDLQSCMSKLCLSKEETVHIKTIQEVQSTRPALFCNSSFSGHEQAVLKVKILNDKICVTAGGDGTIRFWDLVTKTSIHILKISDHWVVSLDVCENYVLAGCMDGNLCLVDTINYSTKNYKNHSKGVSSVAISKIIDTFVLISGGRDNKVFVLNDKGEILQSYLHSGPVDNVRISNNIIVSAGRNADLKVYKIDEQAKQVTFLRDIKTHTKRINDIKIYKSYIITASDDCKVNIHDMKNNYAVKKQLLHKNIVVSAAISSNGQFLATGSFDKTVRLWDFTTGNCLATYFHADSVYKVIFSSNLLISISKDKTVKTFCTKTKKSLSDLSCGDEIYDIDHFGRFLVCGCRDRRVYFFA